MFDRHTHLDQLDTDVARAITDENARQEAHIELIASENYASPAVMEAQGSQLTNKYAEGYPGRRYYGGCEHVDTVEQIAIDRLKKIYGAEAANVQPHSGAQANQAVFLAFLKPGDTIMGLSLAEGGHLTHGMPLNMSGKWFNVVAYGLNSKEEIDYDQMEALAHTHKPKLLIAGASAYSLENRLGTVFESGQGYRRNFYGGYGALLGADRGWCVSESGPPCGHRHINHAQESSWATRWNYFNEVDARKSNQ